MDERQVVRTGAVRLLTDIRSERAIRFYQRVGFQPITCQNEDPEDVCMEMET